jgi:hypothetical protein
MANRLIELAIEALESQRSAIDKEISALRAGFRAGIRALQRGGKPRKTGKRNPRAGKQTRKKRGMSAAAKKAQSLRMKAYWAKRKSREKSAVSQK